MVCFLFFSPHFRFFVHWPARSLAQRRAPGTLANYHSKFTLLGQALIDLGNHDAVDPATKLPQIPMTEEAALAGIQQMTKTRNGKTAAYSTVNSAVVALRFYHEEAGKPVAAELAKKLRSLLEGEVGWCPMSVGVALAGGRGPHLYMHSFADTSVAPCRVQAHAFEDEGER